MGEISRTSIAYERANYLRDLEYTRCNVEDAQIQDALDAVNPPDPSDSTDISDAELTQAIEDIPTDEEDREAEITRIVSSNTDMTIDDIMGLNDDCEIESEEL